MIGFKALSTGIAFLVFTISPDFSFWGEGIRGSGNLSKQTREVGKFTGVKLTNHGNLTITIGESTRLVIEVEDNLQEYIKAEVKGDILVIGNSKNNLNLRPKRKMSYYLTVQEGQLNSLTATSHGDIECPALQGEKVLVHSSSHGDIHIGSIQANDVKFKLSSHGDLIIDSLDTDMMKVNQTSHSQISIGDGRIGELDLSQTSHGGFKAFPVEIQTATIDQTSHGVVKVTVLGRMEVHSSSHGDVYYKGDPETSIRAGKRATVKRVRGS